MASLNRVFLVGNLTRDPEVRYTPSGAAVADLRLASTRVYTTDGQKKEETCFIDVVVWGKPAEACREYLTKGSPLLVEGTLQFEQWQTDGGEKRSKHKVRADRVQFLSRPRTTGEMGDAPEQGAPVERPAPSAASATPKAAAPAAAGDVDDLPF
jgi:single-strand DNA-binding protein